MVKYASLKKRLINNSGKRASKKAGLPPGTLMHLGDQKVQEIKITVIDYNQTDISEKICQTPEESFPYKKKDSISWINIYGLHDIDVISKIGDYYGLHKLLLEDILDTNHRPKIEEYDKHVFLTLKMLSINPETKSIDNEQISLIIGKGWLLTFQEQEGDIFNGLRLRLKENKGNLRQKGTDYLLYRIIDTVVDYYFFVTEHMAETIETLEEEILLESTTDLLREIHSLKKQLWQIRKAILPIREVVSGLQKDTNELIEEGTEKYLRDLYEHIIQIHDIVENQRDMVGSLMELYLSGVSNKMNQVMKVLTIISTIFIPLTFIAGVYGMNFENMPELKWNYGYFFVIGVMVVVAIIMIRFFKRKDWL